MPITRNIAVRDTLTRTGKEIRRPVVVERIETTAVVIAELRMLEIVDGTASEEYELDDVLTTSECLRRLPVQIDVPEKILESPERRMRQDGYDGFHDQSPFFSGR